jgi:Holliday junction resolvasome RuvABC endonuclease subunit
VKISKINKAPTKFCAIDASTNNLAFAVFENGNLSMCGKLNFSGNTNYQKIADAAKKTRAFFDSQMDVDHVVIEHTVFINSPKTAADLALVQGAMLGSMAMSGVKQIKSINPIAWQTFIGNGRLSNAEKASLRSVSPDKSASWYKQNEREFRKQRTIRFVNVQYDKKITDNDVADAIGIGHYALSNWDKLS